MHTKVALAWFTSYNPRPLTSGEADADGRTRHSGSGPCTFPFAHVAVDLNLTYDRKHPDGSVTDVGIPQSFVNWMVADSSTSQQEINSYFCGLILARGHALLDTGAQYGVSGTKAFRELESEVGTHSDQEGKPLKCIRVDGPTSTGGIGGSAKVKFCALCPYGLGYETSGILLILVLDDEHCPTLFPIGLCYQLGMILDTNTNLAHWKKVGTQSEIRVEPSGHTSLNICEFNPKGWKDQRNHMSTEAYAQLPQSYRSENPRAERLADSVTGGETGCRGPLRIDHDELWSELRDPFCGVLSAVGYDFPVQGRVDVRCIQEGTGDPSYFPSYLLEPGISVELWNVGPAGEYRILDLTSEEAIPSESVYMPSGVTSALVWIVYKPSDAYNDDDDDDVTEGTPLRSPRCPPCKR